MDLLPLSVLCRRVSVHTSTGPELSFIDRLGKLVGANLCVWSGAAPAGGRVASVEHGGPRSILHTFNINEVARFGDGLL